MKVHIERNWSTGEYEIYVWERRRDGQLVSLRPVDAIAEDVPESQPGEDLRGKIRPFLSIREDARLGLDFLASLADALAKAGFKNRAEEENLTSVLKAKDAHLEDMRKLVFRGAADE